jgi:hypothetical protein
MVRAPSLQARHRRTDELLDADVVMPGKQFVPKPVDLKYIIEVIARVFADLGR